MIVYRVRLAFYPAILSGFRVGIWEVFFVHIGLFCGVLWSIVVFVGKFGINE